MVTLDQVELLEQKVESAVAKIQSLTAENKQLQTENDALRNKCSELSNALSAKSEQLSFFEQNQSQVESGILNALNRLNSIENQVLNSAVSKPSPVIEEKPAPFEPADIPQEQIFEATTSDDQDFNQPETENPGFDIF